MFKEILNFYVKEVSDDNTLDYTYLLVNDNVNIKIPFNKWVSKYLLGCSKSGKSLITRAYCHIYMFKKLCEEEELVSGLKNYFLDNKIEKIIVRGNSLAPLKFYCLDFSSSSDNAEKKLLLCHFKEYNLSGSKRISPDHNELVRYFSAFFKYQDSKRRFEDAHNDFSYCFYPARNLDWIMNRLKYLNVAVQSESQFEILINDIRKWTPQSFTLQERLRYFANFNIFLSSEQQEILEKLIDIDSKAWNSNNFRPKLLSSTPYEIFKSVILNATTYEMKKIEILSWDIKLEIINLEEFDNIPVNMSLNASSNYFFDDDFFDNGSPYVDENNSNLRVAENLGFERSIVPYVDIRVDFFEFVLRYHRHTAFVYNHLNINFSKLKLLALTNNIVLSNHIYHHPIALNIANGNQDLQFYWYRILFSYYRCKVFNIYFARSIIISSRKRPSLPIWKNVVKNWAVQNIIDFQGKNNNKLVRFNPKNKVGMYMSSNLIQELIKRTFSDNFFTASQLNHRMHSKNRLNLTDLENLCDSFSSDGLLGNSTVDNIKKYYWKHYE